MDLQNLEPVDPNELEDTPVRAQHIKIPESINESFLVGFARDLAEVIEMPVGTVLLTVAGVVSNILANAYKTGYADGSSLNIGLYVALEQPPSTSKSRLLQTCLKPWQRLIKKNNDSAGPKESTSSEEVSLLLQPISNATPEAVENQMFEHHTHNFFMASAEQGLTNMLFAKHDNRPKNFDLALKGFAGEFHSSTRVTRKGISGEVWGGICVIAQTGTIRTILNGSDGDGLAERFLYAAEPHNLGKRKHANLTPCKDMQARYAQMVTKLLETYQGKISKPLKGHFEHLRTLSICPIGSELLLEYKRASEPKCAEHMQDGELMMVSLLGKGDMQAMKLAATFYLSDCLSQGKTPEETIPHKYVQASIELVDVLNTHTYDIMQQSEQLGINAAKAAVYRQFERVDIRTERQLKQNLKKVKPFRDAESPTKYIDRVVKGMVNRGELMQQGKSLMLG